MTRRLCIDMNWQYGPAERARYLQQAVIAEDAGVEVSEVNKLLKMHRQMADMMKKMGKGGRMPQMPGMGGMPGGLPPGMFPGRR